MKRNAIILFAAVVAVALLAGCSFLLPAVVGSGYLTTSQFGFSGFTRVVASQTFKVHVIPDPVYSVSVTCDENLLPYLVTRQNGAVLELGLEQGYNYQGITVSAEVHMPALNGLDLSGASQALVESGISSANPLSLWISGGSSVELKGLTCGQVTAEVSGASTLTFVGSALGETLTVSGASMANLLNCLGTSADATVSGASLAYLNVGTGVLTYAVSGASTLYYTGSPSLVRHDLSGGSRLVRVF